MVEALKAKVERSLRERGLLGDGSELVWTPYNADGIRVSLVRHLGRRRVETRSASASSLRGSARDLANGLVGNLLAQMKEAS